MAVSNRLIISSKDILLGACNRDRSSQQTPRTRLANKLALILLSIVVLELILIGHQVQPVKAIKKKIFIKKLKKLLPLLALMKPKKKIILLPIPIPMPIMKGGGRYSNYYTNSMTPTHSSSHTPATTMLGGPSYGGPQASPSAQSMFMTFVAQPLQTKLENQQETFQQPQQQQQQPISYSALASQHESNDETGRLYYSSPHSGSNRQLLDSVRLTAHTQGHLNAQEHNNNNNNKNNGHQQQQNSNFQRQQQQLRQHPIKNANNNGLHDNKGAESNVDIVDAIMPPGNDGSFDPASLELAIEHELDQLVAYEPYSAMHMNGDHFVTSSSMEVPVVGSATYNSELDNHNKVILSS